MANILFQALHGSDARGRQRQRISFVLGVVCAATLFFSAARLATAATAAAGSSTNSATAILQELNSFHSMGSVLYVAAHPDDENNELIAYFARGRGYRTAYLSLTRGDGGQNVLGPEFGEKLSVARTQELLAGRRVDGSRQFFSRAVDFGFSKDYRETLRIWDKEAVLSDIVRVIRIFRPDVVITRFSPIPGGTHGHHTASTVLAMEAFKLAGNPDAFPDQLKQLQPWQPRRIVWNIGSQRNRAGTNLVTIDAGGVDAASGETFDDLAGLSRSMHRTQGMGPFRSRGGTGGPHLESFQLLDGAPATNDIMDGIDTTWNRVPGGAEIEQETSDLIAHFDRGNPAASVPALLKLRGRLTSQDSIVQEKRAQLDDILQKCLGLEVATTIAQSEVVPREPMALHHTATVHSAVPVRWLGVRYPVTGVSVDKAIELHADETAGFDTTQVMPAGTPLSQPYWLREKGTPGMFRVDDPALIGTPENPPVFPVEQVFEVAGQTLVIPDEPVEILTNADNQEVRRKVDVIPPVSLKFGSDVVLFAPGKSHPVDVEITAARAGLSGTLQLEMPGGWNVSPKKQDFALGTIGDQKTFSFTVTAPAESTTATIIASAEIGWMHYQNEREEISYPHIPRQLLQPLASLKAVSLDLAIRGHAVGYLPGAGDSVADALKEMGYDVTLLDDADLTTINLQRFDAVVIGVRAFNVRTNLAPHLPALFAYVEAGGTVVAQYNRLELKATPIAPYDLRLSGSRVTDETAAMTFLAPDHPALNTPNKITSADFDGWVQERGIYFPDSWDGHFTPILACHDPGESPLQGSLLVAQYGKGYYVYTGLDFFRQLPAGVPGAYRLFANLISLGK
jgi:LmbE family N-acetylglucosaminyl deacetylase